MADDNDTGRPRLIPDNILWIVLFSALGLGGAGGLQVATSGPKYTQAEFERDIRSRDVQIENLGRRIDENRQLIQRLDESKPPISLLEAVRENKDKSRENAEKLRQLELQQAGKR
jgi:hypothetical protein